MHRRQILILLPTPIQPSPPSQDRPHDGLPDCPADAPETVQDHRRLNLGRLAGRGIETVPAGGTGRQMGVGEQLAVSFWHAGFRPRPLASGPSLIGLGFGGASGPPTVVNFGEPLGGGTEIVQALLPLGAPTLTPILQSGLTGP
jgi:hypothetical protein